MEASQENAKERAARPDSNRWFWPMVAAFALVLALASIAMPTYTGILDAARIAEGKQSLHNIQLAVERYGTDHGAFPEYLIGGAARFRSLESSDYGETGEEKDCPSEELISDPLLREGYLASYPRNPFITDSASVHDLQLLFGDELRNGNSAAAMHGTRFGPDCKLMGNVLADFRYTAFKARGAEFRTYADTEYPFFDTERRYFQGGFIPGMFFYKSAGVVVAEKKYFEEDIAAPIKPCLVEYYIMGLYGAASSPGRDILGAEPTIPFTAEYSSAEYPKVQQGRPEMRVREPGSCGARGDRWMVEIDAPAWTRSSSRLRDKDGSYTGSPYGSTEGWNTFDQLIYGSPNGIKDSLVLLLTAGFGD